MSIEKYRELKYSVKEVEEIIDMSKRGENQYYKSIDSKIIGVAMKVSLINRSNAYHDEKHSLVLNKYLVRAANDMKDQLITRASQLMYKDLSDAALLAQDECVQLLQQIGQDK